MDSTHNDRRAKISRRRMLQVAIGAEYGPGSATSALRKQPGRRDNKVMSSDPIENINRHENAE